MSHGWFELTQTDVQMINSRPRKRSDRISYGHLYLHGIQIEIIGNWFYPVCSGLVHSRTWTYQRPSSDQMVRWTVNPRPKIITKLSHILSRLRTTSRGVEVNSDDNKMISNGSIQRTHNRRNGIYLPPRTLFFPANRALFGQSDSVWPIRLFLANQNLSDLE